MAQDVYYFAYGSNMDIKQMQKRCDEELYPLCVGSLSGYQFLINSDGVATVIPKEGEEVYGLLWMLDGDKQAKIDHYEGVHTNTYTRHFLNINTEDLGEVSALVYMAHNVEPGAPRPNYLERIVAAARDFRFPSDYVASLESWDS